MKPADLDDLLAGADDDAVRALCDLIAVPSISARGEALADGAAAILRLCEECGLESRLLPGPGAPVVLAERAAPAGAPTVLFYGHYDVQPPEPLEAWLSDPFVATVRDGAIFGRGAGDNKGQLLAHLFAVRALLARDALGVGVKFLIEGEEEIGSPNLAAVAEIHREALTADLAITSDAALQDASKPEVLLGVRGLLYVEVEARGAGDDVHSGNRGGLAPMPAWDLVRALASLRDEHGEVAIPGFHESVRPPTPAEQQLLATLPPWREALRQQLGVDELPAAAERDPWAALMFRPTLNICGLTAGYQGPGAKTVIPARASAKIDLRLVADQDPEEIYTALCERLLASSPGLSIRKLAAVPPSATSVNAAGVAEVIAAVALATGEAPTVRPRMGGTTPDFVFTRVLGIPSVLVPYGPPDMSHHAPNERMTLAALRRGIRCTAAILAALARR